MINFYLNPNLGPRGSLVISATNPTAIPIRDFVLGNVLSTRLFLVDGLGGFDANSGNETYSIRTGIGIPGSNPAWVNTNWTPFTSTDGNGWSGLIATNTTAIQALFTSEASNPVNAELEITAFDSNGEPVTDFLTPIKIWNRVVSDGSLVNPPSANNTEGSFSIPNGVDTVLVTGLGLSAVPRSVQIGIRKSLGGLNLSGSIVNGTITTDGFRVDLSGVTDSSAYVLDYFLFF